MAKRLQDGENQSSCTSGSVEGFSSTLPEENPCQTRREHSISTYKSPGLEIELMSNGKKGHGDKERKYVWLMNRIRSGHVFHGEQQVNATCGGEPTSDPDIQGADEAQLSFKSV